MKILLEIAYMGSRYHGYQTQNNEALTIQRVLQNALEGFYGQKLKITGCSRTDAGVHAKQFFYTMEGAEGELCSTLPPDKIPLALRQHLPEDIATTFSAQPPYIRSQTRGASHLGVGADRYIVGCRITSVEPGSSADQGGMRLGDIITSFNNVPVRTFETLVKEIANVEPETTVPATVQRGEETIELEIAMQEWK